MNIIEANSTGAKIWKVLLLCLTGFLCVPALTIMGMIRLKKMPDEDLNRKILKGSLWFGAVASIVYAAGMPFIVYFMLIKPLIRDNRPDIGFNAPSVTWLMQEATDISYYKAHSVTASEFKLDEESFRKFLSRQDLQEIEPGNPIQVPRFCRFIPQDHPELKLLQEDQRQNLSPEITVPDGLYCRINTKYRNILAVFSRKDQKVYYYSSIF